MNQSHGSAERSAATPKIDINGVSLRYAGTGSDLGSNLALDNVSFRVGDGEFVAIIGPSGCGKSSLLRLVSGLFPVTLGSITVAGQTVRKVPPGIGFVFQ